jgi:predicted transcriptional regulator
MARVNVFLADDLLEAVDAEAERSGMKRSALVQEALAAFLDERRRARAEEEAQRRMDDACRVMDTVAEKLGDWDPAGIIREFRDARSGADRAPTARKPAGRRT